MRAAGPGQDGCQLSVAELLGPLFRPHAVDGLDGHVEAGGSSISISCPAMLDFPELESRSGE
jgi:hypothetical protein